MLKGKGKERESAKKLPKGLISAYLEENEKEAPPGLVLPLSVLKCKLQPTVWLITIHATVNLLTNVINILHCKITTIKNQDQEKHLGANVFQRRQ